MSRNRLIEDPLYTSTFYFTLDHDNRYDTADYVTVKKKKVFFIFIKKNVREVRSDGLEYLWRVGTVGLEIDDMDFLKNQHI